MAVRRERCHDGGCTGATTAVCGDADLDGRCNRAVASRTQERGFDRWNREPFDMHLVAYAATDTALAAGCLLAFVVAMVTTAREKDGAE